jgi:hypothetical protein
VEVAALPPPERGIVSGPDFIDLVGDDGSQEELEQLRCAHDLLLAAGPPPELSPRIAEAPAEVGAPRRRLTGKRRGTAFLLAAGIAAAAFGVGLLIGSGSSDQFTAARVYPMHPPSGTGAARASVAVGDQDSVGNWPLLLQASGLKPLPQGSWYELYLTRNGKIAGWCGAFNVMKDGETTIRLSVPYNLKGTEWVVARSDDGPPHAPWLLTT